MYIDVETIITAGSLIGALGVIGGMLISAYKLFRKPAEIETHVEKLEKAHEEDIRRINEEQCLITYGLLACLKGLKEQGCNGPVTEDYEYGSFNAVCNVGFDRHRRPGFPGERNHAGYQGDALAQQDPDQCCSTGNIIDPLPAGSGDNMYLARHYNCVVLHYRSCDRRFYCVSRGDWRMGKGVRDVEPDEIQE